MLLHIAQQCDNGSVRLTGGPNKFEGRVEICVGENWGQVCANVGWTRNDARVVCRQLGHSSADNSTCKLVAMHLIRRYTCLTINLF
jgi:hypothetical protein